MKKFFPTIAMVFFFLNLAFSVIVLEQAFGRAFNVDESGVAIKGYDPVAYFTQQRALKGNKEFEFSFQGVRWLFSSEAHRDLFAANPEKYMPQYGGH